MQISINGQNQEINNRTIDDNVASWIYTLTEIDSGLIQVRPSATPSDLSFAFTKW